MTLAQIYVEAGLLLQLKHDRRGSEVADADSITRVGERSKIVMTGDPYQVDHQYLDEVTNGLSYVVEKFKNQSIAGHAVLEKCERSTLASIAADIL